MNKMNKKGFTLIEMLVVIAIIAVLVAIIIPVVGSSTAKARAATDAANLRSYKADLTIKALNGGLTQSATAVEVSGAPVSKSDGTSKMYYVFNNDTVTVYYGTATNTIEHYAGLAGNNQVS